MEIKDQFATLYPAYMESLQGEDLLGIDVGKERMS
jgi:hypothetical protein